MNNVIEVGGYLLYKHDIGRPVDFNASNVRKGIVVIRDKVSGKYAVTETPDLNSMLTLLNEGVGFNKVFKDVHKEKTPEMVEVFFRLNGPVSGKEDFQLTRNNVQIALLGDLAPLGQNEAVYKRLDNIKRRNPGFFDWLKTHVPDIEERMESVK